MKHDPRVHFGCGCLAGVAIAVVLGASTFIDAPGWQYATFIVLVALVLATLSACYGELFWEELWKRMERRR